MSIHQSRTDISRPSTRCSKEYVWPREFSDIQEARKALLVVFEDYNHRRIHSALKYLTSSKFAGKYQQGSEGVIPAITGGDNCEQDVAKISFHKRGPLQCHCPNLQVVGRYCL